MQSQLTVNLIMDSAWARTRCYPLSPQHLASLRVMSGGRLVRELIAATGFPANVLMADFQRRCGLELGVFVRADAIDEQGDPPSAGAFRRQYLISQNAITNDHQPQRNSGQSRRRGYP